MYTEHICINMFKQVLFLISLIKRIVYFLNGELILFSKPRISFALNATVSFACFGHAMGFSEYVSRIIGVPSLVDILHN